MAGETKDFKTFWNCYPNKKAKPNALKAWGKINPDEKLVGAIMAGLSSAKLSGQWQKDDGQYIPHPATWLNQQRWEDDYKAGGANHGKAANGRPFDPADEIPDDGNPF